MKIFFIFRDEMSKMSVNAFSKWFCVRPLVIDFTTKMAELGIEASMLEGLKLKKAFGYYEDIKEHISGCSRANKS